MMRQGFGGPVTIDEWPNGTVIVRERGTRLRWCWLAAAGLQCLILFALWSSGVTKEPVTLLAGAGVALCVLVLAAGVPDRWFAFEPVFGRFTWTARSAIHRETDSLALTDIHDVELDVVRDTAAGKASESYRVILLTSLGPMSLTRGRQRDKKRCGRLADRIWAMSSAGSGAAAAAAPQDEENAA